ncbi:hypothetical protein SCLCIDRAFT_1215226 [Scleroderma citrinum Foug A]|uniref:T6SS Phospholipase effector Tle1-like catalytic domain-containing protein n=1 Tax=Scleroderma citrinum Foug A TaxID=1036808 RepID=A0A0C2ZL83_9AGAM|nr:hypothetical protein SCLCIDRAFT_1215226 [Scleroderma citrinum Foug A]
MTENSTSPQTFPDAYPDIPNVSHSPKGGSSTIKTFDPLDDVIPATHKDRTLVLCFDGTGDQFDADNSNIVQFFSMLKKDDPSQQMVYYQAGIGTYTIPQIATPLYAKISKTIDMMIGNNLNAHVMGGYEFLMQNYEAGDKICLFGFSRGAYTARSLAGMLHKVGLLPRCNNQQVPFAYRMYSQDDETGWEQSKAFKKAFSIDVDVEFVGVWDTVSSVGIIPRRLPFTKANNKIRYFRHALSLDEHRARFMPNFYNRSTAEEIALGVQKGEMPRSVKKRSYAVPMPFHEKINGNGPHHQSLQEFERRYSESIVETDAEEVWFAGCHCDVGGGSVENGTRNTLARIPLRWMIRECFKTNSGVLFHGSMFKQIGLDPAMLYPLVTERPPPVYGNAPERKPAAPEAAESDPQSTFISEEEEDLADALSPIYDQLRISWPWWILEVIPQKQQFQKDGDNKWDTEFRSNMGGGRHIPRQQRHGVKLHRSVKIRMEADGFQGGKYWPKAKLRVQPKWID